MTTHAKGGDGGVVRLENGCICCSLGRARPLTTNRPYMFAACAFAVLPAHACKCLRSSARCARSTGFTSFSVGLRSEEDMLRELFKIVAAQHERPTPDRIAFILVSESLPLQHCLLHAAKFSLAMRVHAT